jgi:hypothetical protein
VVFVSGYPQDAEDPSAHRVLPKPFTAEALAARVRDALGGPAATGPG